MGKAIPTQHPAVALRSQFRPVRALLAAAMVAVVALAATVVILANDEDQITNAGSATQVSTPSAPGPNGSTRYDGGPEEGTAEVSPSHPRVTQSQAFPGLAREAIDAQPDGRRYDGGPDEGTRGPGH